MPRYIDADALRELIDGGYDVDFDELPETKQALLEMIDYQDTVDAVEVVRCRECEHYHENIWGGEIGLGKPYDDIIVGHHGCDRWEKGNGKDMAYTSPNGFRFLGERKE